MEKAKAVAICLFLCFVILQLFDIITTGMCFQKGLMEGNPLMRKVMGDGWNMWNLIYAKAIIVSLIGGIILFMWKREHLKKHIPLALAIGIVMSTATVLSNLWWGMIY